MQRPKLWGARVPKVRPQMTRHRPWCSSSVALLISGIADRLLDDPFAQDGSGLRPLFADPTSEGCLPSVDVFLVLQVRGGPGDLLLRG